MTDAEYDKKLREIICRYRIHADVAWGEKVDDFYTQEQYRAADNRLIAEAIAAIRALNEEAVGEKEDIDYSFVNIPEEWRANPENLAKKARNALRQEIKGIIGGIDGE